MNVDRYAMYFKDEEEISVTTLSYYLYYFRTIYSICFEAVPQDINPEDIVFESSPFYNQVKEFIYNREREEYVKRKYFFKKMGENDLVIYEIEKKSPLVIIFSGSVVALVLATIISGGKVDLKNMRFELNPLGDGLKKMKEFFRM